ncbi:glycosyltransferase family 39 protein [Magnetovibrio sp. PR-2]|uniref:ArnT family glycosyltransferase n=1 Tax=Magnetovibrio sp. PR-2 TaxID=3120356 RepID=UPI002FCE011C
MKLHTSTPSDAWLTTLIWCALVSVAVILRPLLPIDETRYVTVAWEMYLSGDYWVPTKNGEIYSHKPPFFFWLMNLGWKIFGVSENWARLVAPLFGLASVLSTVKLAGALWPDVLGNVRRARGWAAALIVMTGLYWTVFASMTMFDTMVTFAAVLAVLGYVMAWQGLAAGRGYWKGILIAGVGLGIGGLAKGPAILVHTLPLALLAPLWGPMLSYKATGPAWGKWYGGVFISIFIGAGITLAWAIPAAIIGGEEYRDAIFIKQSADRMVKSFAHQRPVYWFLWILPLMLLPWTLWPRLWKALGFRKAWNNRTGLRSAWNDGSARVLLIWAGASFVIFSAISGKQPHYLLPIFPALALLAAYLLIRVEPAAPTPNRHRVPVLFLAGLAFVLMAALLSYDWIEPYLSKPLPVWVDAAEPLWLLVGFFCAIAISNIGVRNTLHEVRLIAVAVTALMVSLHFTAAPAFDIAFNLQPAAKRIKAWQDEGRPVLYVGKYHGEFQFLGRLIQPLDNFNEMRDVPAWSAEHPTGVVLATRSPKEITQYPDPVLTLPKRAKILVVWDAKDFVQP